MQRYSFTIRKAIETDAPAIAEIIAGIAAEQVYSAITTPWTAAEQQSYMAHLSEREAIHVADLSVVVGYQVIEPWAATMDSMAHVAQIGTFLRPEWRGKGVGQALFAETARFAREHAYRKLVIQVRASNAGAQRFYRRLGFEECGRLRKQVRIGELEDDEVLMEMFL